MNLESWNAHRRLVATRAGEIACVDTGEGPAALLVHGLVVNGHLWRPLAGELDGVRRLVIPDLPGHGASPARPDQDLSLPALADLLVALCDQLGLDKVDVAGNDTGGAVCQVLAARHPERVRTLTLTNCDTEDNLPPQFFRAATERALRGAYAPQLRAMAADPARARATRGLGCCLERPEELDAGMLDALLSPIATREDAARDVERLLVALHGEDLAAASPGLAALRVPTMIVWGTADPFFETSWAHRLQRLISSAGPVIELEGGRLHLPLERAAELAALLREHWAAA